MKVQYTRYEAQFALHSTSDLRLVHRCFLLFLVICWNKLTFEHSKINHSHYPRGGPLLVSNKHVPTQRHSKQRVQSGCLKGSHSHLSKSQLRRSANFQADYLKFGAMNTQQRSCESWLKWWHFWFVFERYPGLISAGSLTTANEDLYSFPQSFHVNNGTVI